MSLTPSSFVVTNYGTSTRFVWQIVRADAPRPQQLPRFDVQGLSGSITSATLRIYANSSSSLGYDLYAVTDNTWTETDITYRSTIILF